MKIEIFPYISMPNGITVNFRRTGGAIQERRFPPNTNHKEIVAALEGNPLSRIIHEKDAKKQETEELARKAKEAKPVETKSENELRNEDNSAGLAIKRVELMKEALLGHGVKGVNLMKPATVEAKYREIFGKSIDEAEGEKE